MRAVAVTAAGLAALLTGAVLRAQPAATTAAAPPTGFDHQRHEGMVAVSGSTAITCDRCHTLAANGKLEAAPDHRACFNGCHAPAPARRVRKRPYAIDDDRRRLCQACHRAADLAAAAAGKPDRLTVAYPPYTNQPDYSVSFSHAGHAEAAAGASGCRTCHAVPTEPGAAPPSPPGPHSRCASCHARADANTTMASCGSCHLAAFGPATSPNLVRGPFPVTATFSHSKHLPRVTGDKCLSCHRGANAATGTEVPAPTTADCIGCHDGRGGFSTVEPRCRTCHTRPQDRTVRRRTPPASYSHAAHRGRGVALPCATCHRADAGGSQMAPSRHAPCSDGGCHRAEFASSKPRICGVCHVGDEPWRALHVDRDRRGTSEFGARFDHSRHAELDCARCHQIAPRTGRTEHPRGHDACASAGCHTATGAPPQLNACERCHAAGLLAGRDRARRDAPWSVRTRFDHRPHRTGANGAVPCQSCHAAVSDSRTLADVPVPSKAACANCHDGATAFKMTGHGCRRCHGVLPTTR